MTTEAIGKRLVHLCNAGHSEQAVNELYGKDIVSIEAQGTPEMPARMQGLEAIEQKSAWWFANHEVHAMTAEGPFIGNRGDQFAVKFDLDLTPKGGQRMRMSEVALYTVRSDRIVEEAFLYSA
jgi:predicted ester cyclase